MNEIEGFLLRLSALSLAYLSTNSCKKSWLLDFQPSVLLVKVRNYNKTHLLACILFVQLDSLHYNWSHSKK